MNNRKSPYPLLERGKIILPNEMKIKQQSNQPTEMQIPIFPVPVHSSGSFLIYALCLQAIESGMYADLPLIEPHLQAIKSVMEQEYLRFGIPAYEYRKFVIHNQATNLEEVLARANITWEALLNLVNQRVETEFVEEYSGGKNAEMGTEEQKER